MKSSSIVLTTFNKIIFFSFCILYYNVSYCSIYAKTYCTLLVIARLRYTLYEVYEMGGWVPFPSGSDMRRRYRACVIEYETNNSLWIRKVFEVQSHKVFIIMNFWGILKDELILVNSSRIL